MAMNADETHFLIGGEESSKTSSTTSTYHTAASGKTINISVFIDRVA